MAATIDLLPATQEQIAEFCRSHHIVWMAVFGSTARGEQRPDSDLDILVEFEPGYVYSLFDFSDMRFALEELFQRPVDLVPKAGLKPLIRDEVIASARAIYPV
jgi:uncharacterized protein